MCIVTYVQQQFLEFPDSELLSPFPDLHTFHPVTMSQFAADAMERTDRSGQNGAKEIRHMWITSHVLTTSHGGAAFLLTPAQLTCLNFYLTPKLINSFRSTSVGQDGIVSS